MIWLLIFVGLGVCAVAFHLGFALIFVYVAAGVIISSRILARHNLITLDASRHCSAHQVAAGEPIEIQIRVGNRQGKRIPWVLAEDLIEERFQAAPRLRCTGRPLAIFQWNGQTHEIFSYQASFLQRGYYQIGPLLLESGDWFGLYRRFRLLTAPDYVLVYPKVLFPSDFDFAAPRAGGAYQSAGRLFEDPTRICGVRPYLPGDPLNRIHWPATARSVTFHSKMCEPAVVSGATFLLDFHKDQLPEQPGPVELGVTAVASLARHLFNLGQPVGFATNGIDAGLNRVELPLGMFSSRRQAIASARQNGNQPVIDPVILEIKSRGVQFEVLLEILARLRPTARMNFAEMIDQSSGRLSRETVLVPVLYEVPEETAVALGALRRSGYTVAALVIAWGDNPFHDWALPPDWAGRLLSEGIRFRVITSEESVVQLLETPLFA